MEWFFKSKKEKGSDLAASRVMVSTGDIPYNYDIIHPVWAWTFLYNGDLEASLRHCNLDDLVSKLQLQAYNWGCDAIINMRVELNTTGGASTSGSTFLGAGHAYNCAGCCMFCYGTAVKISYGNNDE